MGSNVILDVVIWYFWNHLSWCQGCQISKNSRQILLIHVYTCTSSHFEAFFVHVNLHLISSTLLGELCALNDSNEQAHC